MFHPTAESKPHSRHQPSLQSSSGHPILSTMLTTLTILPRLRSIPALRFVLRSFSVGGSICVGGCVGVPGLRSILCVGVCLMWTVPALPAEPTLARLSFRVPSDRMVAFDAAFKATIAPILNRHDIADTGSRSEGGPGDLYTKVYRFDSASQPNEPS